MWEKITLTKQKESLPYVSLGKQGIGFSKLFCKQYGITDGTRIDLFVDHKNKLIGFKVLNPGDDGGVIVSKISTASLGISSLRINNLFPDCRGRFFTRLNENERLIIAYLNK